MNQKQTKIFEAYKEIYSHFHSTPRASDQEEFLVRLGRLSKSIQKMYKLECRGVEQHEFNLGLTEREYLELQKEIIEKLGDGESSAFYYNG